MGAKLDKSPFSSGLDPDLFLTQLAFKLDKVCFF